MKCNLHAMQYASTKLVEALTRMYTFTFRDSKSFTKHTSRVKQKKNISKIVALFAKYKNGIKPLNFEIN